MKINHLKRYFVGIVMTAFLVLLAGNAFADKLNTDTNPSRDYGDGGKCDAECTQWANNYMVVSPYWQVEGGGSYTFVAVSHSSLSGMASQIGVKVNAITSAKTAYATAQSFTVSAGATRRVFIIPTNHSTINSTTVPTGVFVAGTTNFTYGHLRFNPVTSHPMKNNTTTAGVRGFKPSEDGDGFRDSTMLTYWGSVIVEANTTGFAMEFIGDLNDSHTTRSSQQAVVALGFKGQIPATMGSGVNLQ